MFGAAITKLRIAKTLSQEVVAAGVGCDEYYLRNIEQGKENFSFDIMFAIIRYYEMLPMSKFWQYAESLQSGDPTAG